MILSLQKRSRQFERFLRAFMVSPVEAARDTTKPLARQLSGSAAWLVSERIEGSRGAKPFDRRFSDG